MLLLEPKRRRRGEKLCGPPLLYLVSSANTVDPAIWNRLPRHVLFYTKTAIFVHCHSSATERRRLQPLAKVLIRFFTQGLLAPPPRPPPAPLQAPPPYFLAEIERQLENLLNKVENWLIVDASQLALTWTAGTVNNVQRPPWPGFNPSTGPTTSAGTLVFFNFLCGCGDIGRWLPEESV